MTRSKAEVDQAWGWVQGVLQKSEKFLSIDLLKKALVICERYEFAKLRNEALTRLYCFLVKKNKIEEAEKLRISESHLKEKFTRTTEQYFAQRAADKKAWQLRIQLENIKKAAAFEQERLKPVNQLKQALLDDKFDDGARLIGLYPELQPFLLEQVKLLVSKTHAIEKAKRWSELLNQQEQIELFKTYFAYRLGQKRLDLVFDFYHGLEEELVLIKTEVEKLITGGDLRVAIKVAQKIGGEYEAEISQQCLAIAEPWQNSANRSNRVIWRNLSKLINHQPYHSARSL